MTWADGRDRGLMLHAREDFGCGRTLRSRSMIAAACRRSFGVSKRYGSRDALRDVDFIARHGQLHGLLGPNGAGKTTLMRVMLGLVRRDAGSVHLLGAPVDSTTGSVRRRCRRRSSRRPPSIRICPDARNLSLLARLDGGPSSARRARVERALEQVGLSTRADIAVWGYSAGMRQRLGLAAALLRSPQLLLLDEPTSSLDPAGARDVRALVRRLAGRGSGRGAEQPRHGRGRGALRRADGHQSTAGWCIPARVERAADARAGGASRAAHERRRTALSVGRAAARPQGAAPMRRRRSRSVGRRPRRWTHTRLRSGTPGSRSALSSAAPDRSNRCSSSSRATPIRRSARAGARLPPSELHASAGPRERPRCGRGGRRRVLEAVGAVQGAPAAGGLRRSPRSPSRSRCACRAVCRPTRLFGRAVNESGFAVSLVVLGFAALWAFPVLTGVVGGDLFSAEDRYGTWATVLTRSRSRAEIFAGKDAHGARLLAAGGRAARRRAASPPACWSSATAARRPVGHPASARTGIASRRARMGIRSAAAFGFTALGILLSVATRSSAAGIGLPVVIGLLMQLVAFVDGPERSPAAAHHLCVRRLARSPVRAGLFTDRLSMARRSASSISSSAC